MATVPPQNTMLTGSNGEQKPRKLRASCDACSRAKVKCDKVRPTCHRCGNMGICCNYSPSMRLGKPRKNRNPDGTIMRDVSPANSNGPLNLNQRPDMIPRTTSYTTESSPEPTDPFFFGPATPEYHFQDAYMPNAFDGSQSPFSETSSFINGWSNDDHLMFTSPSDMFTSMPPFSTSPYASHVRSSSVHSQPEMFAPMEGINSPLSSPTFFGMAEPHGLPMFGNDKMTVSPPAMAQAPLPTPPGSATTSNHDCTQFAFQTLNSLYSPPASQPTAEDFNGSSNGLPTLDTVISTNKSAVDKLFVLLGCPCSSNPHFSTTIAFTIVKILSWYQAISCASQSEVDSPITRMEAFSHSPMSMSDYSPMGESDDSYRAQLVLTELRKVEKLIDKFSERYTKNANLAESGIDGGVYSALESLLRTRVRDTFKVTMRNAPEDVKRQVASRSHNRSRTHTL
ncbi:Zn-II 2Cys6 regulatory protein [Bimuria novae-zelandiae CBS 107.79]|uniref:Zn-II 2Cys6 regulatory protein n=1 Tax=Bimuria novae-zelandiae CBS 107.79 TaxID=1447943 RepID=A0A6A5UWH9_9PLEO|nr:Zn-II 2Cys6 regulatory protein [Bimuria novae-zelandiae CBS 107.79]